MLHLRVICPGETTPVVLALLAAERGATHVTVTRGVAVEPAGDLVEVDVVRSAADQVLDGLTAFELPHRGAITFEPVDSMLSDAGRDAVDRVRGGRTDTVVWQQLVPQARRDAEANPTFFAFLTIAVLLAAVGVATASPLTIVGAMVVGPEFGPLSALAIGLNRRDRDLVRRATGVLALAFPVAMLVTAAATLLWRHLGWISTDDVDNARSFDFIYEVGPFSLVVALLAGAAGMLAVVTARSAALVGVFISVTTVPAAGLAAAAAVAGKWQVTASSLAQLVVNLVGIVAAGVLVLALRPGSSREDGPLTRVLRRIRSA
ncbi:DUF389 domain-containing protein [Nocardia mexicana]|uniref:Putative hydrophobic protein (TIGR00271 family) n=1 Tax=Nocardia mexicana TaxID=279262 RepID=A0A370H827_9NOCA|nr:DUF389 domain-containing protein [Nocardia mexicana]RDI52115.1 putative hydrophobic protein (TIGR00271 family) [Nocardia mexicana]